MSVSSRAGRGASIVLAPGESVFVGIDAHRASLSVTLWSPERGVVAHWTQPPEPALLIGRLRPLRRAIGLAVQEAGPTGYGLVRALRQAGIASEVIVPARLTLTAGEAKCDRLDAERLAHMASLGLVRPVAVPTAEQEADRELVRARERTVRSVRRAKQQIRSMCLRLSLCEPRSWSRREMAALTQRPLDPGLRPGLETLLTELGQAQQRVKALEALIAERAGRQTHRRAVEAMTTVPGVGLVTAMTFRTELFAPERFECAAQVVQWIGLAPRVHASGQSRGRGAVTKAGNRRLRTALIESAWRWVARDEAARQRYRRHLARSGRAPKAIVAMARHLAGVLWALSVRHGRYRPACA